MLVKPKAAAAKAPPPLPAARPQPVVAATPAPAPSWEPLPDDDAPLPDYTPPAVPPAASPTAGQFVSAFDTRAKYSGRGRYKGPKNRAWLKYAVLGVFFLALAGGVGAAVYLKPDYFKSLIAGKTTDDDPNGGSTANGGGLYVPPNPGLPPSGGAYPRRMLAISVHNYLYANPLHNGESDTGTQRTGTDAAVTRLSYPWKVPNDQVYHLTDISTVVEEEATTEPEEKPLPKPEPKKRVPKKKKKGPAAKDDDEMEKTPADPVPRKPSRVRKPPSVLPLKSVIEGTITKFLETSRAQDRIVILFCGHVAEKNGTVYLVPLEGDFEEGENLIPLKWFYDKLAACPAQEKVVIYDVCRINFENGIERPHPGVMSEAVEKALHESPEGVSVVTSCSKGEHAIEVNYEQVTVASDSRDVKGRQAGLRGSVFLSLLNPASELGELSPENRLSSPADELPLERMAKFIGTNLSEVVKRKYPERTQTLKATIKRNQNGVAFNAAEPMPGRFDFPAPPPSADPRAVKAIVSEIQLPPIKTFRQDAPPASVSDVLPFSEAALKDYMRGELRPTDKLNEFQQAVVDAVREIRDLSKGDAATRLPEEFGGETSDRAKEDLRKVQEIPARVESILQDHLDNLETVAEMRDKQPKRWQVHFDYVLAQVKLRICYANQYNLAMANVRGGKLPDLKDGQNGYRLTAEMTLDKNTPSNYKDMFTEARKALVEIAKKNPNTPWALLAKSDKSVAIGLRLTGGSVIAPVR
jgi:hypothetical protein